MFARLLLSLAAFLLCAPAIADDHDAPAGERTPEGDPLEGHWAFRIDDATIFVFALEQDDDGNWTGAWTRPETIDSNGAVFRRMSGQQTVRPIQVAQDNGALQLTFAGPGGIRRNDVLRFSLTATNLAQLNYVGIPGDPYPLVRVLPDTPLGPFDDVRIYDRDNAVTEVEYTSPAEMAEPLEPIEDTPPDEIEESGGKGPSETSRITPDFLDDL